MTILSRLKALLEVLIVLLIVEACIAGLQLTPWAQLKSSLGGRAFLEYLLVIAIPLLALVLTRRNLAEYGIVLRPLRYHLEVAAIGFVPVVITAFALNLLDWKNWWSAFSIGLLLIIDLQVVSWLLRKHPRSEGSSAAPPINLAGLALALVLLSRPAAAAPAGSFPITLIFFLAFVAPGEELLFRGYIQTRLDQAFGKPFHFGGIHWGPGLLISALLFGLWHVLTPFAVAFFNGGFTPVWPWAFWTVFLGILLGYLRERTGSLAAPALLHAVLNIL